MARTAPDATATLNLNGTAASDAALKTLLGSAPGKLLRGGPLHDLVVPSDGTGLFDSTMASGDTLFKWEGVMWLYLHALDISELHALPANWMLQFCCGCNVQYQELGTSVPAAHQNYDMQDREMEIERVYGGLLGYSIYQLCL